MVFALLYYHIVVRKKVHKALLPDNFQVNLTIILSMQCKIQPLVDEL